MASCACRAAWAAARPRSPSAQLQLVHLGGSLLLRGVQDLLRVLQGPLQDRGTEIGIRGSTGDLVPGSAELVLHGPYVRRELLTGPLSQPKDCTGHALRVKTNHGEGFPRQYPRDSRQHGAVLPERRRQRGDRGAVLRRTCRPDAVPEAVSSTAPVLLPLPVDRCSQRTGRPTSQPVSDSILCAPRMP